MAELPTEGLLRGTAFSIDDCTTDGYGTAFERVCSTGAGRSRNRTASATPPSAPPPATCFVPAGPEGDSPMAAPAA